MTDWADRMTLPGPTNFVADVAADIEDGRSTVVLLPQHLLTIGGADHIVDALQHRCFAHEVAPDKERNQLSAAIASCFDPTDRWRETADAWRDLVSMPGWRGECVIVRAWDYDVDRLLTRWSSLITEQQLDSFERPRFVVVARREDLDEAALEHIDLLHVRIRWWWSVVDRLDTEASLARRSTPFQREPLRRAVMAEVASWDLDFADHLLTTWDGDVNKLNASVASYAEERVVESGPAIERVPAPIPTLAERDSWDAGVIDVWDGVRRDRPWHLSDADLRKLVWRAQNRVFMPRLDERRAELEREFVRAAPESVLRLVVNEDGICELGSMRWAANTHGVRLAKGSYAALSVLTKFRNCLAHGRPADAELLAQARHHL